MTQTLTTSLASAIAQAHDECMRCDDDLREIVLRKVNKARECGTLLISAKEQAGHGAWGAWVRDNLRFGEGMAQIYMRFARANPQPITDLKDGVETLRQALIASGALAAPQGHGQQQRGTVTFLDRWTHEAQALFGLFNAAKEKTGEPETWPEAERAAMKAELEPLVRVYERL